MLSNLLFSQVRWYGFFAGIILFSAAKTEATVISNIGNTVISIEQQATSVRNQYLTSAGWRGRHHAEERLIDGENYYRLKDYQRAAIVFMDIIESYPEHAAYPDALFYFADSLFLSRDYYGARTWFEKFLEQGEKPGFSRFKNRAVSRLVEIAIHLSDYEGIEEHIASMGKNLDKESSYVKGKYHYFKEEYDEAVRSFRSVSGNIELELKAAYFLGTTLTKQEKYDEAITVFRDASNRQGNFLPAEQEIIELCILAQGRLLFEKDFVENAAAAYQKISRYSTFYDIALYEAAAVQMRAGNTIIAERILEVLTLSMPDSSYIPRAKLLRGNLLLRAGRYDEAEKVFGQTVNEFSPVQDQIDKILLRDEEEGNFFDLLTRRAMGSLDMGSVLPAEVVKWASDDVAIQRAFAVTDDLGVAAQYTRESEKLLRLISAIVEAGNAVSAFPHLRMGKKQAQKLRNQVGRLRYELMLESEKRLARTSSRIVQLAPEVKELSSLVRKLPVDDAAFEKREEEAKTVFLRMRKELSRQEVLLDSLMATVVALERYIEKSEYKEEVPLEALEGYRMEMDRHKEGIWAIIQESLLIKEDIEKAIYLTDASDELYFVDIEALGKINKVVSRQRAVLRSTSGDVAVRIERVHSSLDKVEKLINSIIAAMEQEAERQIVQLRIVLKNEREKIEQYKGQLTLLNDEAREVVTGVARENFGSIKERFYELLLKADVGIIDVAWLRKEEHKSRSVKLSRERMEEINALEEEFMAVGASAGQVSR